MTSAGDSWMREEWDDFRPCKRRRSRRRSRRRYAAERDFGPPGDDPLLGSDDHVLYAAQRTASRKAKLTGDVLKFSLVAILLLTFIWPLGIVVLICFGPRYLRELYSLAVEPRLRERFLRDEVEKQVHAHLSEERRQLENAHARSMERLSASIAHEIRNPITAAKSLVQQMEEDPDAHENVEYARVALAELTRVERSVSHLLRFARDEEMQWESVRLADIVESALETFRDRLARSGIELEQEIDCEGLLEGDAEQLRRVVINLVGNAVDAACESATPPGRVDVALGENLAGTEVWLRVADNGPGLDAEALDKMWSPFYTSKQSGTGLGLPITRKLVEAHGGHIEASPRPSSGAEFVLTLPKRRASKEADS